MEYNNQKSININAVMKNPQLAKLIDEALKAPLGSTKREKARAVLSSLNKAGQNTFDGMGGSPYSLQGTSNPLQGSSNYLQGSINPTQSAPGISSSAPPQDLNVNPTPYQGFQQDLQVTGQPAEQSMIQERVDVVPGLPLPKQQATPTGSVTEEITPPYGMGLEGLRKWDKEDPEALSQFITNLSGVTEEIADITRPEVIPSDMWEQIKKDVEGNIGADTSSYFALGKLKEWLPGVPEAELPTGAIWTDEIPAIRERLDEEYQLNSLLDNVERLDAQGLTIESDLQAYIRGRDKYIKNINNMIDNVNDIYTDRDVSDPRVRSMLDKYRNYLYMSKGRQEVRYNGYVTRSIQEHEYRLKRATDKYNNNFDKFESELKDEKDMTEERYEVYSNMLKDLYNSLDEKEKEINEIGKDRLGQLESNLESEKSILEYIRGTVDPLEMTNANLNTSYNNYITALTGEASEDILSNKWNSLSDIEKRAWLKFKEITDNPATKAKNDGWSYKKVVKLVEAGKLEGQSIGRLKAAIASKGYAFELFLDLLRDYVPAGKEEKTKAWWLTTPLDIIKKIL